MRIALVASVFSLCAVGLGAQGLDPRHQPTTPDVPGLTAEASKCPLSTDRTYGLAIENPVKVGGGDMYMASRQVKFLSALRGPAGEGVHFKRTGSMPGPDGTILDAYMLDIKGDT